MTAATVTALLADIDKALDAYEHAGRFGTLVTPAKAERVVLRDVIERTILAFVGEGEAAYIGSKVASEVLQFFEDAGCGRPGTPNTVWAMTQELVRKRDTAVNALGAIGQIVVTQIKEAM